VKPPYDLNTLRNASRELRSSLKFKQVLQAVLAVGNALNDSTFRGRARGFSLNALPGMYTTTTARGGRDCPTLLHYFARVLIRTDPSLITFIEDMPNVEAAARTTMEEVTKSVNSMFVGLSQVNAEITHLKSLKDLSPNDQFIRVMQPFASKFGDNVAALKNMSNSVDSELRSLLQYYGEDPDGPDCPTPDIFFGWISSFSSSLQKCAREIQAKLNPQVLMPIRIPSENMPSESTIKAAQGSSPHLLSPQGGSQGHSVGRGDLDQAIRSMRDGNRRVRPSRPLSKIFFDGGRPQSRMYD